MQYPESSRNDNNSGEQNLSQPLPLIVLVGPTAVGKTETAIQLALRLNLEILSADSRYLYRGMDIGTAKPSPEERANVPHHLIDVTDIDKVWSLADFQKAAFQVISEIHERGRLPILVGGSGQYVRAITENWVMPRVEPNLDLRGALSRWSDVITAEGLHRRLQSIDPVAAAQIEPRNLRRTIRALEVIFISGSRFSDIRSKGNPAYDTLMLGLTRDRSELYERIDQRVQQMFDQGFVSEVEGLLAKGYATNSSPFSAIGYREIIQYLAGAISLDDAISLIKHHSRIYIRRQANWFKLDDPGISWVNAGTGTIEHLEMAIQRWLTSNQLHR